MSLRLTALIILSGTLIILSVGAIPAIWMAYLYDRYTNPVLNDCDRIAVGQSYAEVENLFSRYDQDEEVIVNRSEPGPYQYEGSLSLYTLGLFDDYQCTVFFIDGKVVRIEKIAD